MADVQTWDHVAVKVWTRWLFNEEFGDNSVSIRLNWHFSKSVRGSCVHVHGSTVENFTTRSYGTI